MVTIEGEHREAISEEVPWEFDVFGRRSTGTRICRALTSAWVESTITGVPTVTAVTPQLLIDPNDARPLSEWNRGEQFPMLRYRGVGGMPGRRQVSGDAIGGPTVPNQADQPRSPTGALRPNGCTTPLSNRSPRTHAPGC